MTERPVTVEPGDIGPVELLLTTAVARRFYLDSHSKVQIAQEFGISRFKVARLLDSAKAAGLVRIEIGRPPGVDVELSDRLRAVFGLRAAVVADVSGEPDHDLRDHVGGLAARLLGEIVGEGDVLGVAWGRSLQRMSARLTVLPRCTVVQLCGAVPQPDVEDHSLELTRRAAQAGGGTAVTFYAPLVMPDASSAAALRGHSDVAKAMQRCGELTAAVVSIGGWSTGTSTVHGVLEPRERAAFAAKGAVAELCGILLDAQGRPLADGLQSRAIGITFEQLHATNEVVALAYGSGKATAVRAALRGGLITTLVTDAALAKELLAQE
ncbi:sugar-binding transcriptional regulator [Actinoalloteichus hymeniacidonis]|uniref:Transcriptional regulator with sigma factor-related N-terminal domain n=1 Tax=Actinoalloteichus hymeniacidonis TaxID=340345 RepID=A0AAC9HSQ2_9PSEU|nr:sugar-binding domain-containing protein [Actinoalloteichus hymeniacidonis]AOS64773.1 transcriptional regulator with sigma factor-related N-terminal domain [Actinoalloteichus hymeniacidonis]MBB5907151.1 DNA-binding transcriptional regulator LsrR (DeoR family) [Actinoalloteichus hymeniacidonis]